MIAKNYMKHPEALRFQRELFSNGYHNSPRIMRLMECIFDWTPAAPAWWTAAKARARALAKAVKKSIADFFKEMTVKAEDQIPLDSTRSTTSNTITTALQVQIVTTTGHHRYTKPDLDAYLRGGNQRWNLYASGAYRRFCPTEFFARSADNHNYASDQI